MAGNRNFRNSKAGQQKKRPMSERPARKEKNDIVVFNGIIEEVLPNAQFRVKLDNSSIILAYTCGKIVKNKIKITEGDRVDIEVSVYDNTRGRIVYRY